MKFSHSVPSPKKAINNNKAINNRYETIKRLPMCAEQQRDTLHKSGSSSKIQQMKG